MFTCFVRFAVFLALMIGPQFRDAAGQTATGWRTDGTGRYPDATPPLHWGPEQNIAWKTKLPGQSYGSPIIVGERIFVVSDPAELLCIDKADGEILWQHSNTAVEVLSAEQAERVGQDWESLNKAKDHSRRAYEDFKKSNPDAKQQLDELRKEIDAAESKVREFKQSHPIPNRGGSGNTAATPVSDGKTVYAVFGSGIVAAYSLDGRRRWIKFIEGTNIGFGHGSSLLLAGGKLIVHLQDLVALDAADGEVNWRTPLDPRHASPLAMRVGGDDLLISPAGSVVRVADGKVLVEERGLRVSECSPVIDGRIIYAQAEKTNAYQLKADGDAVSLELLWESTGSRGRRTPSPVLHDGLLYGVTTEGILDVTDAKTGEAVYRERLDLGRNIYASVTSAGGYLFIVSTDGATLVFKPGRQFTEIARNMLESLGTCPVFAGNRLYLRGQQHLYCIEEQ